MEKFDDSKKYEKVKGIVPLNEKVNFTECKTGLSREFVKGKASCGLGDFGVIHQKQRKHSKELPINYNDNQTERNYELYSRIISDHNKRKVDGKRLSKRKDDANAVASDSGELQRSISMNWKKTSKENSLKNTFQARAGSDFRDNNPYFSKELERKYKSETLTENPFSDNIFDDKKLSFIDENGNKQINTKNVNNTSIENCFNQKNFKLFSSRSINMNESNNSKETIYSSMFLLPLYPQLPYSNITKANSCYFSNSHSNYHKDASNNISENSFSNEGFYKQQFLTHEQTTTKSSFNTKPSFSNNFILKSSFSSFKTNDFLTSFLNDSKKDKVEKKIDNGLQNFPSKHPSTTPTYCDNFLKPFFYSKNHFTTQNTSVLKPNVESKYFKDLNKSAKAITDDNKNIFFEDHQR